jgi:multidrug efflux pump subunit AcrB
VVRNGIILVGYAEELRQGGLSVREAAIAAGKRRMRPIFLTSAAAAVLDHVLGLAAPRDVHVAHGAELRYGRAGSASCWRAP